MISRLCRLALLPVVTILTLSTSCTMGLSGKFPNPSFVKYSRQYPFDVRPATHRVGDLELTLISGSLTEVRTVVGSVDWTAYLQVRLANLGNQPINFEMNGMEAIRTERGIKTAVYFSSVELPSKGQGEVRIAVPAGLNRLDKPVALVYKGVRLELN